MPSRRVAKAPPPRPWDDKPETLHPKQRIFFSIDAIGSTDLKTQYVEHNQTAADWGSELLELLPEAPVILRGHFGMQFAEGCPKKSQCASPCYDGSSDTDPQLAPWKYIGDEVVMVAELKCEHQPQFFLQALIATLNEFNQRAAVRAKERRNVAEAAVRPGTTPPARSSVLPHLEYKGTAWVAGFPVTNLEVALPGPSTVQGSPLIQDFLGPSIDLGFRLAKHATKERLIISTSLAYLLKDSEFPIYSAGKVEVKGVKKGEHPLFWLRPSDQDSDDEVLTRVSKDDLAKFFKKLTPEDRPFILATDNFPQSYLKKYPQAAERQQRLRYSPFFKESSSEGASSTASPDQGSEHAEKLLTVIEGKLT